MAEPLTLDPVPHSPPSGSFRRGMARVGFWLPSALLSPSTRERLRRRRSSEHLGYLMNVARAIGRTWT
jgi:hypothetical protein